jgi:hypothetical protein
MVVDVWNRIKGGIDKYSRYLKDSKAEHKSLHVYGIISLRMLMTIVYNAYQSFVVIQLKKGA